MDEAKVETPLHPAKLVLEPDTIAELRILNTNKKTVSGYFDDFDKLAAAAAEWDGRAPGVYVTLNPVNPDLLARSSNHLTEWAKLTTSDSDIVRRRWLPIDCDPVRPSGISSTDAEHDDAIARAKEIGNWLMKQGWPKPVLADSGNGGHLLCRIDLPNDQDSTDLIKRCLEALDLQFGDDAVTVDVTNYNPARIWKVYNTTAAKGDSTPERPHRVSKVLFAPPDPETVDVALLKELADTVPKNETEARHGRYGDFDLERWIADNLSVKRTGPWQGGTKWILETCPWNPEHTDGSAAVLRLPGGQLAAKCHHNGCAGNDWAALRSLYEPEYEHRREQRRDGASAATETATPEPVTYHGPVPKLAALLGDVRTFTRRYVVLSDAQADTAALWTAHTHTFDAAESTPYLSVTSAEKKSGKTRLLEVEELIVARPWLTGRVTPAALYRRIHAERPTLLLDESDSAFRSGEEYAESLRGILNTGHRRGGSTTVCVGQGSNMTYGIFSTFSPKAIAGIGRLPDTVEDRAISIVLKRKAPGEKAARFKWRKAREEAAPLKEGLEAWASASVETLTEARPDIPAALDDRAADGWEVLLAIADLAGGDWPQRARSAALELSVGDAREDESLGVLLLANIRDIFTERGVVRLTCAALVKALVGLEEAPWADIPGTRGKPLDTRRLGWRLKPFQIKSRSIRLEDGSTPKGYQVEQFVDAWARYLPSPPLEKHTQDTQPPQTADTDTGDVAVVTEVALSQGMGKEAANKAQRLRARSLWGEMGRPANLTLDGWKKIVNMEKFIAAASADDLDTLITELEKS